MASTPDHVLAPKTLLAGKYEIQRRLGSGGMGAVYEARHVRMNKRVAVKVIHPQYAKSGEAVGRFLREAEAAARIRHPNVIDVVDIDERNDPPFMVLEYLEGRSLATILEKDSKLSAGACAALLLPVLSAVAAAHDHGIVHRDLKPENIFVARAGDGSIRPVVLDFGVAKIEGSAVQGLTQTNTMVGTVVYMSPEQARDSKRVDAKSDQYTLGVILYECVAGVRPCDGESLYTVLNAIVEGRYRALRDVAVGVPPAFEAIVAKAMAKDPEQRFASVRAMAEALAPLAQGQSFSFSRDSWATEFAFGSTMSADGSSDSAVAKAVEAVVGARPGAISAQEHADRVSSASPLSGPTLHGSTSTPSPSTAKPSSKPELVATLDEASSTANRSGPHAATDAPKAARAPAPSTLGGSSVEVSSPLTRAETVGLDRDRGGHRGLLLVVSVTALALIGGLFAWQRATPTPQGVAQRPVSIPPSPTHTIIERDVPEAHTQPAIGAQPSVTPDASAVVQQTVERDAGGAVARNHGQSTGSSPRSGRNGRPGPATGAAPPTQPTQSTTSTNNAGQDGPRQVGGGFVL
ncbi:MAG: serine/threonine protein kinase [Myxococcales bacterium]|nr:serine/threonine protein kinase [Myxococcales bacterium]